ncbi:FHA domain-containing protein [Mobilicoccus massiliensis]|uniref:FHA domain-containing protein n=1 Tax=Mobilicoccus massiliensis TaxID=1522310 RepID=UPI00058DD6C4|nr:FHA domain-containing protein [Mobilicoccus massiliensis]
MTRCPDGHDSAAEDYCDVCGVPMDAPAGSAVPSPGVAAGGVASTPKAGGAVADDESGSSDAAAAQACPHCGAVNAEDNLFCEVCGFDFTTGVMPRVEGGEPSFLDLPDPVGRTVPPEPRTPAEDDASPAPPPEPAQPVASPAPTSADSASAVRASDDPETPVGEQVVADAAVAGVDDRGGHEDDEVASPDRRSPRPVNRPPSREVVGDWVVEVWIDPDWYAEQDTEEACPSPAPPEVVPLVGSDALIGRRSRSSVPDIDCGIDSAVSRRQALLTSDGRRWWIEDLDSSNGTWIGPAVGPLPSSPITGRTEVDADDRVYVGAWTRLVVRPATAGEIGD